MKVAVIYNKQQDVEGVINVFGMQNQETYNPKTVERVASALEKGGHNVRIVDGNIKVIEQLESFMPRVVHGEQPGMVFNMAYGIQGVSRYTHIPSLLEMVGIPYVGSSPAGHGVALDKVTTKVMVHAAGLPTAPYWVFYTPDQIPDDLPYPVITKPKMEAVSLGIEVVHNKKDLQETISRLVEEFRQPVLVEKFIPGREFAVGLLGNQDPEILPVVEIDLEGDPNAIQTLDDKLRTPREKICPARIDDRLKEELSRLTRETFRSLGIYDFCRVDFRMDDQGNLYILELNSMASLGLTGSYVLAAKTAGYSYESLINRMLDVAVERYFGKQQLEALGEQESLVPSLIKKTTTPLHTRLRSYLRGNLSTMEASLQTMVETNSYVRNIDGINALGQWIGNLLSRMGFHKDVITRAEFGNMLYFTNHNSDTNDILVIGQLDNPSHFQDFVPYAVDRGKIYGTGVSYGKGGLAILLAALQGLRYTRSLKKVKCGILLVSDESAGGRSSKSLVADYSSKSKAVVGLQGAGLSGELIVSTSGQIKFNIEINRMTRKGQADFKDKYDLVSFISQKIISLRKLNDEVENQSVTITSINTHGVGDQPPDHASLVLHIRYRKPDQKDALEARVFKLFEIPATSPLKIHITRGASRKPLMETPVNIQFMEKIGGLAKMLEVRVQKSHTEMPSILTSISPEIPHVEGLGPVTGGNGTKSEYVVRDSLIDRSLLLAYLISQAPKNFSV
ncbi:MAG: M20/M25/M40 family metallo-hydrolase [Nitrospinota bacterium]|nr:M20/M25/M40 family metallo-hydrolase [Nitrospinota bacterium]